MGNMFFNIGQMADFLTSNPGKPVGNKLSGSSKVEFESFVQSLTGQQKQPMSSVKSDELTDMGKLLSEYLSLGGEKYQAVDESNANNSNSDELITDETVSNEILNMVMIGTATVESSELSTALNVQNVEEMAAESYEAVQVKTESLKQLITDLSEPVMTSVELDDTLTNKSMNQLAELNSLKTSYNENNTATLNDNIVATLNNNSIATLKEVETTESQTQETTNQTFDLNAIKDFKSLDFDIRQLVDSNKDSVEVTALDSENNQHELSVKTDELKAILKESAKPTLTEVPVSGKDSLSISDTKNTTIGLIDNKGVSKESVVIDLKTLADSENKDQVKVVIKTVESDKQNLSSMGLLSELKLNNKDSVRLKLSNASKDFAVNELTGSNNNSVKASVETSGNQNHSNDKNNDESNKNSELNVNTKSATVTTNQSSGTSTAVSKEINSTEINATHTTSAKDVSSSVESKADILTANDNSELIENITGQLRSRLTVTNNGTRLTIDLKPEYLGKINIDFTLDKNKLEAVFRVDNGDVKAILDSELPKLKHEFKIDSYRVETNTENYRDDSSGQNARNMFDRMAEDESRYRSSGKISEELANKTEINETTNKITNARTNYGHGGSIDLLA